MKLTLILFGNKNCTACKTINEVITDLKEEYNIVRISTLSFFSKDGQIKTIGIDKSISFINNFLQHLGSKYAALFKYNPETQEIAYIDLEKYFYTALVNKKFIKVEEFKQSIENAPYNVWPPSKTE
ncbi:thioredoxin-like protein [Hypsugopox virus]|nr:thioredoxin-like protein [Hypsugopox virus]